MRVKEVNDWQSDDDRNTTRTETNCQADNSPAPAASVRRDDISTSLWRQ